ncbi:hypothetical protein [Candidatus Bodocaedibacter vickermanii]|uniref:Uncharacterized protein n=1 Tax=Candidatus Bodocaedibacter vickermanii TaxID=2741701 RepID=A0A7L9RSB9_9PROT|nr:hypothetical protein CPBP_00220 [Candidatus Paracaedibacteraceae bacterium 'Lake Konstanz']
MNLRSFLHSTSSIVMLSASCILLTGCGGDNSQSSDSSIKPAPEAPTPPTPVDFKEQLAADNIATVLAFNGFSENGTVYDTAPLNLAGDLSAVDPANLYLYDTFINAVGTETKPSTTTAANYTRQLPASKKSIQTGNTLLNPGLAMNSTDPAIAALRSKLTVSSTNPVILSIPAGIPQRPEAPFFPGGTKYTAVLAESPKTGSNHGPIVSIEAGSAPLQFAAFSHQQGKTFVFRTYDAASTTDKSGSRVLLTAARSAAVMQSRFVVLSADGLANNNLSLQSIDRATLPAFGFGSGKALLQNTAPAFPQLLDSKKAPIFNDGNHGVFCLGGNNTFNTVDLKDQTFVYPLSASDKTTRINTLNVSANSGFITESGKHLEVTTLNGNGTLKLIAVMKGAVAAAPIVHVTTLNGVSNINVVVGVVDPAFSFPFPATGMTLLSFDNALASPLTVTTEDAHMAGAFYDGESELRGKNVVLKSLTRKAGLSSGSTVVRSLMAHHPRTQGISSREMHSLIATLDPMTSVHQTLGSSSAALSQHTLGLQAGSAYSANQTTASLADHVTMSASHALDHTVASINLNSRLDGINLATSIFGASTSNQRDVTFGSSITASKSLDLNGALLIPSVAVGYSMDAFSDTSLSANGVNINITNPALNSVFARLMTAFNHEHAGLSTTLAMGLAARHAMFSRGLAASDHDSVSLAGESTNGVYSIIEASFASNASRLNITLSNFNHAQIQFGLTD